jgi:methyltransferase (TIGR00027 family)
MRPDRPSRTAAYVCMGRALANARGAVRGFSDPVALELLPSDCRAAVERRIRRQWPRSTREAVLALVASATERLMGPRTAEIDDALRSMKPGFQLVILGAGLDARAYRMTELAQSAVYEVDHPASQAFKRERTAALRPVARELHHVPVDFSRERFGEALERAGHQKNVPTAWVFEGVISYLTHSEVHSAVEEMAKRSAPGSLLLATYNEPSWVKVLSVYPMRWTGEPQRAVFAPEQMKALLGAQGFAVRSDRNGAERAARWREQPARAGRLWRFHHVVAADFAP